MLTRWTCYRQGTQHDPELLSAEPEYAPATLRQIGETMAAMCARFAPHCYALDAWQLTFGRPSDSEDGRVSAAASRRQLAAHALAECVSGCRQHFDYDTPALNTILSLLVNAVGVSLPASDGSSDGDCCSVRGLTPAGKCQREH